MLKSQEIIRIAAAGGIDHGADETQADTSAHSHFRFLKK